MSPVRLKCKTITPLSQDPGKSWVPSSFFKNEKKRFCVGNQTSVKGKQVSWQKLQYFYPPPLHKNLPLPEKSCIWSAGMSLTHTAIVPRNVLHPRHRNVQFSGVDVWWWSGWYGYFGKIVRLFLTGTSRHLTATKTSEVRCYSSTNFLTSKAKHDKHKQAL